MSIENERPTLVLLSEKSIEGEDNPVLRLLESSDHKSLFLALSGKGLTNLHLFAGGYHSLLSPDECRKYYDLIKTLDEFNRLSDRIRDALKETLNQD